MEKDKGAFRRRWWIAGLLSYLVPGLGQVYGGRATRGLLFNFLFATWGGIVFGFIFHLLRNPAGKGGVALLFSLVTVSALAHLAIITDAIRSAVKGDPGFRPNRYNKSVVYLGVLIVSLGVDYSISSAVREQVLKPFRIPTGSMESTLEPGDFLLSNQLYFADHNPARGDVVIFKSPADGRTDFIKRIIGLPGDTIETDGGRVRINGKILEEPYVKGIETAVNPGIAARPESRGPLVIPRDSYYVLGDNRDHSTDSRRVGPIPRHNIKGKPMVIYFSSRGILKWRMGRIGRTIR
jgi:signal peptidase I